MGCEIITLFITSRHLASDGKYSSHVLEMLKNPESEEINLDLIAVLIQHICITKPEGAILVFLPGWDNISNLHKLLKESINFPPCKYNVWKVTDLNF